MFSSFLFQISYKEVEKKKYLGSVRIETTQIKVNTLTHTFLLVVIIIVAGIFYTQQKKKLYFKTIKEGYPSQKTQQYNTTPHILIKPIFDLFNKSKCLLIDLKLEQ